MKKIFYLIFPLLLISCKYESKAQDESSIDDKCNGYYGEKYAEFFNKWSVNRENERIIDSTLYYLNKQINCNPKDIGAIQEKANFLIYNKFYEKALIVIDSVSKVEPFFKMMKGTIGLKLDRQNSEELLKEAHGEFSQYIEEYNDPNDIVWKLILDNYLKGKEYALSEAERLKKNLKKDYEVANIEAIEQMIREMSKEDVLYHLFKIE